MRRLFVVVFATTVVIAVFAAAAAADQPTKTTFYQVPGAATGATGICSFPIDLASIANITEKDYYVKGVLTKVEFHVVEQDTFSATGGGPSLTSIPYTYDMQGFSTAAATSYARRAQECWAWMGYGLMAVCGLVVLTWVLRWIVGPP